MASMVDEYRGKAHEAHVTELETHDPFLRRSYSKLARHWNELADRVERENRRITKGQPVVQANHRG